MKKTVFAIMLVLPCFVCSLFVPAEENGQGAYNDILDKYYYAFAESWNPVVASEEGLPEFMYDLTDVSLERSGFRFLDLDGDGTQELLIGICPYATNMNEKIEAIYYLSEDGVKQVEIPLSEAYIAYIGDGMVYVSGKELEAPFLYVANTYQIQNIEGQVGFVFQRGTYFQDGQFYRNITEQGGDIENDEVLSEEEYYQLEDELYQMQQEIEYTSFSGYVPSSTMYSDEKKQYQIPETITLGDKTYTFPFSLDVLLDDGWSADVLAEDSWEEAGIQYNAISYSEGGSCTKDGFSVNYSSVKKEDADPDSKNIEDYFVHSISVSDGTDEYDSESDRKNYPLKVLNGFSCGDSIDGLEDYLIREGYKFTSSLGGLNAPHNIEYLDIKVYFDSYSYDYLDIRVDYYSGCITNLTYYYGKDPKLSLEYTMEKLNESGYLDY